MPSDAALAFVRQFKWSGDLKWEQEKAIADAIDQARTEERARCADIAQNMAHAMIAKRRTNAQDRNTSAMLVLCRDKMLRL